MVNRLKKETEREGGRTSLISVIWPVDRDEPGAWLDGPYPNVSALGRNDIADESKAEKASVCPDHQKKKVSFRRVQVKESQRR